MHGAVTPAWYGARSEGLDVGIGVPGAWSGGAGCNGWFEVGGGGGDGVRSAGVQYGDRDGGLAYGGGGGEVWFRGGVESVMVAGVLELMFSTVRVYNWQNAVVRPDP